MSTLTPELVLLVARRFALLGEPTRLLLLNALHGMGEASVGELAEAVNSTHANVSKHLNLLLGERILDRRRDGSRALYRIADPTLIAICEQVCDGVRVSLRELGEILEGSVAAGAR